MGGVFYVIIVALCFSFLFMIVELTRVNKYISWYLAVTPLFFLFAMIGLNRMNRDYPFYEKAFYDENYRDNFEFGYRYLVKFLNYGGFDHTSIVLIVGFLLMFILLKYLYNNNNVNLVIFFYCSYVLIYDINQTRNTLMYLIIILSLIYVIKEKPIKHYILWFVAFSFHKFALIYLPFYYLCKKNRRTFYKIIIGLTFIFLMSSPLIIEISSIILPDKMSVYLTKKPGFGVLAIFIYTLLDIFIVWLLDKKIGNRFQEKDKKTMETLYRFIWFPILILPFTFYFLEVIRIQRNSLLVKYIYCALAMKYMNTKERLITLMLLLLSTSIYISILIYSQELELYSYLNDNYIVDFLKKYIIP